MTSPSCIRSSTSPCQVPPPSSSFFLLFLLLPPLSSLTLLRARLFLHAESYPKFKATLHNLFPTILDTKSLCFGVQRVWSCPVICTAEHCPSLSTPYACLPSPQTLSQAKLLEFTGLADLYEALGRWALVVDSGVGYAVLRNPLTFLCSQRGISYVLYTPEVSHADSFQKYSKYM